MTGVMLACVLASVLYLGSVHSAPAQPANTGHSPVYYYPQSRNTQGDRYLDAAPQSLSPSIPWPEWLPQDLSLVPNYNTQPGQFSSSYIQGNQGIDMCIFCVLKVLAF